MTNTWDFETIQPATPQAYQGRRVRIHDENHSMHKGKGVVVKVIEDVTGWLFHVRMENPWPRNTYAFRRENLEVIPFPKYNPDDPRSQVEQMLQEDGDEMAFVMQDALRAFDKAKKAKERELRRQTNKKNKKRK